MDDRSISILELRQLCSDMLQNIDLVPTHDIDFLIQEMGNIMEFVGRENDG